MRLPRILAAAPSRTLCPPGRPVHDRRRRTRALITGILTAAAILATALPAAAERSGSALRPLQAGWLDVGANHTCAIRSDGGVYCWGNANVGRLGYGNTTMIGDDETPASAGPVALGPGRTATQVAVGYNHTCVILDTGAVACWGQSSYGELGYGNTSTIGDNETPASAGTVNLGGHTAVAITAGMSVTCAIIETGDVKCWGRNDHGQLGLGSTANVGDNETPAAVGTVNLAGQAATAISAGDAHVCAVLDTGSVYCWGWAASGRLGYGNGNDVGDNESPWSAGPVSLGGMHAVAVAAGSMYTCALGDAGEVRCWGSGSNGQLGYGNTDAIGDDEPAGSAGVVDVGATAVAISAGQATTCATTTAGALRCWGWNVAGQQGRGDTTAIGAGEAPASAAAVTLGTGAVKAAATGATHTCALRDDDTVWCWGGGANGLTGHGNTATIGDDEAPSAGNAAVTLGGPVTANVADLSLAVTPASPSATVGNDVTFTLTLTNDGPDVAGTPTIGVSFTGSPTVVSAMGSGSFGFGTWAAGNLAAGQTATLTLVLRPTTAGSLTVTADLDGTGTFDPDSSPGNALVGEDDHAAASVTVAAQPPAPPSDPAPGDPAPSRPGPVDPAPRLAPRALTLVVTPSREGRRLTVTGRLLVPAGTRGACDGSVRVTATSGRRTTRSAMAPLRTAGTACGYTARLTLPARAGRVTVTARFAGNDAFLPASAAKRTVRFS